MKLFEEVAARGDISGQDAFDLTATYGFPFELTTELALERGLAVDEDDFRGRMEEHREISPRAHRCASSASSAARRPTSSATSGRRCSPRSRRSTSSPDGRFEAKLERSPFYAEGGGQVSDTGFIEHDGTGAQATLLQASRVGDDQVLTFEGEGFAVGDRVRAVVPWSVRFPTMANHTATHLLHEALRRIVGEHVQQAGSAVRPDKLRFDFTHDRALTQEERDEVERLVNEQIFAARAGARLRDADRGGAQARRADALRREVRRHRARPRDRGLLARALRRHARPLDGRDRPVRDPLRELRRLGRPPHRGRHRRARRSRSCAGARTRRPALRAELEQARKEAKKPAKAAEAEYEIVRQGKQGDVEVLVVEVRSGDPLEVSDRLKQQFAPAAVIVGSRQNGNAQLVVNVDKSLEARGVHAGNVVREAAALIGGGGGGRPTMARAGGKQPEGLDDALSTAERLIVASLS